MPFVQFILTVIRIMVMANTIHLYVCMNISGWDGPEMSSALSSLIWNHFFNVFLFVCCFYICTMIKMWYLFFLVELHDDSSHFEMEIFALHAHVWVCVWWCFNHLQVERSFCKKKIGIIVFCRDCSLFVCVWASFSPLLKCNSIILIFFQLRSVYFCRPGSHRALDERWKFSV